MTKNNQLADHYFRSLNRNIILIIIIVSVIPLILVSSTIYYQFRVAYHEKVYDHLRELVNRHTQNLIVAVWTNWKMNHSCKSAWQRSKRILAGISLIWELSMPMVCKSPMRGLLN